MPEPNMDVDIWPPASATGHPLSEYDDELAGMMAELSAARVPPSVSLLAKGLHEREGLDLKASSAYVRSFSVRTYPALIAMERRIAWALMPAGLNVFVVIPFFFWLSRSSLLRAGPFHFTQTQRATLLHGFLAVTVLLLLVETAAAIYINHISRRYTRRVRRFHW